MTYDDVTAVLVTRGDVDMQPIIDSLPYGSVVVWDNSRRPVDYGVFGRYLAIFETTRPLVYFQDDDLLFTRHDELMAAYEPGGITAVYAHGDNDGGYGDVPMVGAGALVDKRAVLEAFRTLPHTVEDYAYSDFHVGILTPFKQVHLPFEINYAIAQHPSRLANQPWAAAAKARVTGRARKIRDRHR